MLNVELHPYSDADLVRLQAALAEWTRAAGGCGYCHPGYLPHLLYEKLGGRALAELVQLWQQHGRIVGISINGLFDSSFMTYVSPTLRGTQAELAMLQAAYQTTGRYLRARQLSETPINTDVYSCDGSRIALLRELGFKQHRVWDTITERSLSMPLPAMALPEGFTLRSALFDDYAELALLRNDAFGESWTPEIYRDSVMLRPGYQSEHEIIIVAANGTLAAFTTIRLDNLNSVGLFEPVATRPAFQRRGLARAMLLYGLAQMHTLGMRRARVEYDTSKQAAHALYASLGFEKLYETLGYEL